MTGPRGEKEKKIKIKRSHSRETDGRESRLLTCARARLPSQTETCLQTYSQFSTQTNLPPKPTEEEKNAEARVQELLDKASLGGSIPSQYLGQARLGNFFFLTR